MQDQQILDQITSIVQQAGDEILLPAFGNKDFTVKADNSLVTETDYRVQSFISDALSTAFPEIKLLGEEMDSAAQNALFQHSDQALWCLDPLDGTTNYAMGVPYFAISLALIRARHCALGVVYDPVRKEMFSAINGHPARLNGSELEKNPHPPTMSNAVALVDFKRLSVDMAQQLAARPPYRSQRSFGSVALDWCWLAAGRGQLYLHGKQNIWDYAAGSLVLTQTGGYQQTLEGTSLAQLTLEPRSAVAALHKNLFESWREYLSAIGSDSIDHSEGV